MVRSMAFIVFWKEHTTRDAALAQLLSAAVVEYISSRGVNTKLFSLASRIDNLPCRLKTA
jgi:hypothetical protein